MVGYKVRHRSPAKVADEIEHLLSYGIDRINIADDIFTANKQRVKEFCAEIMRRNLKFNWSAFSRVNTVDKETLQAMKDAGCDAVSFGIESGNPDMLKLVKKGITLDQARAAVRYCKEVDMRTHASFMIGLPGETHQTMMDSLNFAEELDIEFGYHLLAPFPGTTVRENVSEYDLEILTNNWNLYDANQAIVRTSQLSPEEMDKFLAVYEKTKEDEWDQIKKCYHENRCTPYESLRVEGDYRMRLIFRLLTEDIITEMGTFPIDGHEPATELALRLATITGVESSFINWTLDTLVDAGYLKFDRIDGHVSWFWTHNNRVDRLSAKSN